MPQLEINESLLEEIQETAKSSIELIFDALDIKNYVNSQGEIRCGCPIHKGDNPTAFSFLVDKGIWQCFTGLCHEDTYCNIFGLVMGCKELSFIESVKWLMGVLKIEGETEVQASNTDLREILKQYRIIRNLREEIDGDFYEHEIDPIPIKQIKGKLKPSQYFNEQFSQETISKFMISDCTQMGKPMFNRAFCPVLDELGNNLIGVSGRTLYPKCENCHLFHRQGQGCPEDNIKIRAVPKWKHFGFCSGGVLYNIWNAKPHLEKTKLAVLTEGPKNAWWLDQHGIQNAVSMFGLKVNKFHIRKLIECGVQTLVMGFDNDKWAKRAMKRHDENGLGNYFKIYYIDQFLKEGQDIADINSSDMMSGLVPFIKNIERHDAQ